MAACVVTLDLNPAGGWVSDEMSITWTGIPDWDSWDSSAWRNGSGEMERRIRGLGSDAPEQGKSTGVSGVQVLSESLFGRKTAAYITKPTIWLIDGEQFGILPR